MDRQGNVELLFRLSRIQEHADIIGADGKRYSNGCILIAQRGTVRRPRDRDPLLLTVNRHAIGAIGYFDARRHEGVFYSLTGTMPQPPSGELQGVAHPRHYPLFANNIGKTLSQPERELIKAYVGWVGNAEAFGHNFLRGPGLYTDLFYRPRWALFEAKSSSERHVLRYALGQVLDYQRYYVRRPQLALLLPEQPQRAMIDLLLSKRVAVVWRSRGGTFKDSLEGALTDDLR